MTEDISSFNIKSLAHVLVIKRGEKKLRTSNPQERIKLDVEPEEKCNIFEC